MENNFKSFEEYRSSLINELGNIQNEMDDLDEGKLDNETFKIWVDVLDIMCESNYIEYINNVRENYAITADQFHESFERAKEIAIGEALASLTDKGLVTVSIGEDGELLYGLTEEGKQVVKENNKDIK